MNALRSIVAALFALACPATVVAAEPPPRPNFVVLLCDDLGYGDLGCYDHPHIETPHLDALAAGGVRFTDCYSAAPVCSPSRVGLMTGRNPNRAGVYDWIPKADGRGPAVHMRAEEVTLPALLRDAGYRTAMAGKWHCNSRFNDPSQPQPGDAGFDHWLATQNNADPSHRNPTNFVRNGEPVGPVEAFSCQFVVDEAIDWVAGLPDDGRPFFLYLAFHEPHEPVASPAHLVERYVPVAKTAEEAEYFANIANIDAAVGRLLARLDASGHREDTVVLFTSDNGPETLMRYSKAKRSYGRTGPLKGRKLHTTDGGVRVSGIASWPGRLPAGKTISAPVSSLDLFPTFCRLAGATIPAGLELDGIDLVGIENSDAYERDRPLLWAYYRALNERRVAMRHGNYKVLAKLEGGTLPLLKTVTAADIPLVRDARLTDIAIYDVTTDPSESLDLAAKDKRLAARLTAVLERAYAELVADSHVWPAD